MWSSLNSSGILSKNDSYDAIYLMLILQKYTISKSVKHTMFSVSVWCDSFLKFDENLNHPIVQHLDF